MGQIVCGKCMSVHKTSEGRACPMCGEDHQVYDYHNSDEFLKEATPRIIDERKQLGLDGLIGGLECVIINTQPERLHDASAELLRYTGMEIHEVFEEDDIVTCVLRTRGAADIVLRARAGERNPFRKFNTFPKSQHLPDTRLETFVFHTPDIEELVKIQKSCGFSFLTDDVIEGFDYRFIQTVPSEFTGNSTGFIQWRGDTRSYTTRKSTLLFWDVDVPDLPFRNNIKELDHTAARVRAQHRDAAIIEFMELTNYNFDKAIYVKVFNSITNVARLSAEDFAMVFTSGIAPYRGEEESGPTEKYIHNYGTRVHHMAFRTEDIDATFKAIKKDGMKFLIELVGSPDDGLKQTFTKPSRNTLLVNEYIHRYGDFDGFFTKSNVTALTGATEKQ